MNQRSIYDLRYSGDGYDGRSAVPVLTAESAALCCAAHRAADSIPGLAMSWYSALSHIPGVAARAAFFGMLSEVTDPHGDLVVAPSVSGDLVDLQKQWREKRLAGDVGGHPIEADGDVIYETELSQSNFWHVFGTDLWDLLEANAGPDQRVWLEAVRLPAEEFQSADEEQLNYRLVQDFNQRMAGRRWAPDDYRQVHTAAAIRSGSPESIDVDHHAPRRSNDRHDERR